MSNKLLGATIGFVIGCLSIAIFLIVVQISVEVLGFSRVEFRAPILFFIFPLIASILGYIFNQKSLIIAQATIGGDGLWTRLLLAGSVFWSIFILAYVFAFEPFGYFTSDDEWLFITKVIVFPIGLFWFGSWIFAMFMLRK